MTLLLDVGHMLLIIALLVFLDVISFQMVVRRSLLAPQVAPATR